MQQILRDKSPTTHLAHGSAMGSVAMILATILTTSGCQTSKSEPSADQRIEQANQDLEQAAKALEIKLDQRYQEITQGQE